MELRDFSLSWSSNPSSSVSVHVHRTRTHTPITKPRARRLEPIAASPWPASASHEQRHVSLADSNNHTYPSWGDTERTPLQLPSLKGLHAYPQPPAPLTRATSGDFWTSSQIRPYFEMMMRVQFCLPREEVPRAQNSAATLNRPAPLTHPQTVVGKGWP